MSGENGYGVKRTGLVWAVGLPGAALLAGIARWLGGVSLSPHFTSVMTFALACNNTPLRSLRPLRLNI
ncbi:MAG: hypothetical protein ACI4RD_02790 [Kiritimatiellia bacterium]